MSHKYEKLFEPCHIGKVEIKNRMFMAPMGPVGFADQDGGFTRAGQEYYIERARGGVGLLMTGTVNVDYNEILRGGLPCPTFNPVVFTRSSIDMVESVHAYGAKFFLQLTGGLGRSAFPGATSQQIAPSPAKNRFDPRIEHRAMTTEEIKIWIGNFVKSAVIAQKAGFDGVEIHAVHEGYLLDQFGMSFFNQRTDEYGGSLENRLRPALEIVQGIKQACGRDFPVSLRFSPKSFMKGYAQGAVPGEEFEEKGRDIEEGIQAAKILVEAGYDALNVDVGCYDSWYWNHPPVYFGCKGMYLKFGKMIKQHVDVPVLVAGRMDDPEMACEAIGNSCDMVGFGRPLLADPFLPQKLALGKEKDIRPCIGCHMACMGRASKFTHLSCAVNPQCGFETERIITPAEKKKRVLVAGGGVGGMECGVILKKRGHEVILAEKGERLGGILNIAAIPDFKKDDRELIAWFERQLKEEGIEVRLNTQVTSEYVKEVKADAVVTATGGEPIHLDFGGEGTYAMAAEVFTGNVSVEEKAVIIGGGLIGCELALYLLQNGKEVSIVEIAPALMGGGHGSMPFMNWSMLVDLLKFHKADLHTSARVTELCKDGVVIEQEGTSKKINADTIILAAGYRPVNELYQELEHTGIPVYNIGDSRSVNNIMQAIWDGFEIGHSI